MLSLQTVLPNTLEPLKELSRLPVLEKTLLVGGTALALQYGHRQSVDLDFFGQVTEDTDELTEAIRLSVGQVVLLSATKRIRVYSIQDGSEYRALLSMSYFADADVQAMPYMFEPIEWDDVKERIKKEQEIYNNKNN